MDGTGVAVGGFCYFVLIVWTRNRVKRTKEASTKQGTKCTMPCGFRICGTSAFKWRPSRRSCSALNLCWLHSGLLEGEREREDELKLGCWEFLCISLRLALGTVPADWINSSSPVRFRDKRCCLSSNLRGFLQVYERTVETRLEAKGIIVLKTRRWRQHVPPKYEWIWMSMVNHSKYTFEVYVVAVHERVIYPNLKMAGLFKRIPS